MLKIKQIDKERIIALHHGYFYGTEKGQSKIDMAIEFLSLRKTIFGLALTRQSEVEIISTLLDRMAGLPVLTNPLFLIEYDYKDVKKSQLEGLHQKLRKHFENLPEFGLPDLSRLSKRIDDFMPCRNEEDLAFGIETLYALTVLDANLHEPKFYPTPLQDGEMDD